MNVYQCRKVDSEEFSEAPEAGVHWVIGWKEACSTLPRGTANSGGAPRPCIGSSASGFLRVPLVDTDV